MVASEALRDEVRTAALDAGLDVVGVTSAEPFDEVREQLLRQRRDGLHAGMAFTYRNPARSTDPSRALPGAASLIVGARRYLRRPPTHAEPAPLARVARYAWTDAYEPLRAGLLAAAGVLTQHGFHARVVADDNALVDRAAAVRAGIGWYGKNANVLLPGHGSWFVLGSVITDADLDGPIAEPVADGCGACTRCLRGCPTGAIVAPGVVDARRCLAWLVQAPGPFPTEFREALGDRIYGCDDCQEVCPLNRVDGEPEDAGPHARDRLGVLRILQLDDAALLVEVAHWYIPKREPRYVRRNALIVLGNTGDAQDPGVRAALQDTLASSDPLLRAHAVWAAARLGIPGLADALALTEADPMVRAELDARALVRPPDRGADAR